MSYDPSSRERLTTYDLRRFPDDTLFHRVARVLCEAACLPRRELFESWEVARRTRRRLRGRRIVDLACGHALIGQLMLLIDPGVEAVLAVDRRLPPSAEKVAAALGAKWQRLAGRVQLAEQDLAATEVRPGDVIVSCHACGKLTDRVLDLAIAHAAPVAVLPCCQDESISDTGGLEGWVDRALAIDIRRAEHLRAHGYVVHTQAIPAAITSKNRLLIGQRRIG